MCRRFSETVSAKSWTSESSWDDLKVVVKAGEEISQART
jgi:hypothetical protein